MFDGSSIAGWKAINESDMLLSPDLSRSYIDPVLPADHAVPVLRHPEPGHRRALQPRPALDRPQGADLREGVRRGRPGLLRPEAEFFVFDDVRWTTIPHNTGYAFDSIELPSNTGKSYRGNMGHRPDPRAATSRSTRWTAARTCAARCWR
jgi:glutamine synthetase